MISPTGCANTTGFHPNQPSRAPGSQPLLLVWLTLPDLIMSRLCQSAACVRRADTAQNGGLPLAARTSFKRFTSSRSSASRCVPRPLGTIVGPRYSVPAGRGGGATGGSTVMIVAAVKAGATGENLAPRTSMVPSSAATEIEPPLAAEVFTESRLARKLTVSAAVAPASIVSVRSALTWTRSAPMSPAACSVTAPREDATLLSAPRSMLPRGAERVTPFRPDIWTLDPLEMLPAALDTVTVPRLPVPPADVSLAASPMATSFPAATETALRSSSATPEAMVTVAPCTSIVPLGNAQRMLVSMTTPLPARIEIPAGAPGYVFGSVSLSGPPLITTP